MSGETFIRQYKTDSKICDGLINYHKKNAEYKSEGMVSSKNLLGAEVNKNVKESVDVNFFNTSNNKTIVKFFSILQEALNEYIKYYGIQSDLISSESHNIQYYPPGGGFKIWHCERSSLALASRQLVYMIYLNNVPNGGTEFKHQQVTIEAEKGKMIIWPSDFTHTHRGVVSMTHEKYIATGWINLK